MNAKDALGRHGEDLAAEYLQQSGLRVLDRNWRCADGEIDIRWVVAHGVLFDEIRVDAIGVLRSPSGEFTVSHARGVG